MKYGRRTVMRVMFQICMTEASAVDYFAILLNGYGRTRPIECAETGAHQLLNPYTRLFCNGFCACQCKNVITGIFLKWLNNNFIDARRITFKGEVCRTAGRAIE